MLNNAQYASMRLHPCAAAFETSPSNCARLQGGRPLACMQGSSPETMPLLLIAVFGRHPEWLSAAHRSSRASSRQQRRRRRPRMQKSSASALLSMRLHVCACMQLPIVMKCPRLPGFSAFTVFENHGLHAQHAAYNVPCRFSQACLAALANNVEIRRNNKINSQQPCWQNIKGRLSSGTPQAHGCSTRSDTSILESLNATALESAVLEKRPCAPSTFHTVIKSKHAGDILKLACASQCQNADLLTLQHP